jgi:mono/diheme cytochrome c family protein
MRKFIKLAAIILGSLVIILLIAAGYLSHRLTRMMAKTYNVADSSIPVPADSASIARGQYFVNAICAECHGMDLSGTDFFNDPKLGAIHALNLTKGKGGIGSAYSDEDWIRAIRHGVRKSGHGIMIMPSQSLNFISDSDLACIVSYLKSLPPVDKEWEAPHFTFLTRVIAGAGGFGTLYAADIIDHAIIRGKTAPAEGPSSEYGDYLVKIADCRTCHGDQLSGMQPPDPGSPLSPNITPGGEIGKWDLQQFITTMRSGITPTGKILNHKYMPWLGIGRLNDDALQAIFHYLQTQPKIEDKSQK